MNEPDLSTGQWRDISTVLTEQRPTGPMPAAVADHRVARLQARAAEKRADRHDAIQARAEERRTLREDRRAARAEARERRAEKRADRADNASRAKNHAITLGRSILVTGPILAPMAVAWTGQSQFAIQILGWAFAASVLYAAAYELTTVYWAWLYHQARSDGDSGWEYRLGTWIFATGAAVQQWWHYSDHWAATPRAVTYSVMSGVGVLLWEGRARLIHRRKLRTEGKLPPARPSIGPARWVRYPVRSWTAWSLITLEGHRTLDAAWTAADTHLRSKKAEHADRTAHRRIAKADRVDRAGHQRVTPGPDRTVTAGPSARAALPASPSGGPVHSGPPAPVSLTKAPGPAQAAPATPSGPAAQSGPAHQAAAPARPGPQTAASGPAANLNLNETEQEAVDRLRSTNRSISKRSIADVVRKELGRSIASDRAAEIARHFRTLRSAA